MGTYKNFKPSVIGLNHEGGSEPRLINPGQVFDADENDIPKGLLASGWVQPSKEKAAPVQANAPSAAQPGLGSGADNPRLVGVPDASPTDQQSHAAALPSATSAAERSELTRTAHLDDGSRGTPDAVPSTPSSSAPSSSTGTSSSTSTPPSTGFAGSDDDTKSGKKHK